jgi:glycerophosphoryl diester phosphodiesterase
MNPFPFAAGGILAAMLILTASPAGAAETVTQLEAIHLAEQKAPGLAVTGVSFREGGQPAYVITGRRGGVSCEVAVDAAAARVLKVTQDGEETYAWPGVITVGHRGTVRLAPENTIAAIEKAIEAGVHLIEVDIRQTADGHLVLMHDPTVDRPTDGSGPIAEMTLAEVRRLDAGSWFSDAFAGEPVPTLAEAVDAMAGRALPDLDFKAGDPGKLVEVIRETGLIGRCTLYCGDWDLLQRTLSANAGFLARPTVPWGGLGLSHLVETFDPPLVNIDWHAITEPLIHDVHLAGKAAFLNTMGEGDGPFRINAAIDAGADYLQSDDIEALVRITKERGVYADLAFGPAKDSDSADGLVGGAWQFGPYILTFHAPPELTLRIEGDNGIEPMKGTYEFEGGEVTINMAGQRHSGTFDGETLTLSGNEGTRRTEE